MLPTHPFRRPRWPGVQRSLGTLAVLVAALAAADCRGPDAATGFSLERASKHVRMLGTAFGSRPTGSEANRQARAYVVDQLRRSGFEVRLQEAMPDAGGRLTTPTVNIVAVRPGRQSDAVALVSHYDSTPESRGAADDGLGVAICLEAGRVLAERSDSRYTLVVAVTDGEELGLMGARALRSAPDFSAVRVFLNFEAVGTTGPPRLFQSGPGNQWLSAAWAASVPHPSGSSLFTEVYRRLPNDTDFSVLKSAAPGFDFAPTGNSFAYHTPLDTPAHLQAETIQQLGDNTVRLVEALDGVDIRQRSTDDGTFFDVAGRMAFAYTGRRTLVLAVAAFIIGLLGAYRAFRAAHEQVGSVRLVITALWAILLSAALFGALLLACYLLRMGTRLEQPWYGQGWLFAVFLGAVGFGTLWTLMLLGRQLPVWVRPSGRPACVWVLTLPVWAGMLAFLQRTAPGVGYLFAWPLLVAGVLLLVVPLREMAAGRLVSLAIACVAGVLWVPLWGHLLDFAVAMFGRLPFVPPVWFYPALVLIGLATVGPSVAAAVLGRESGWIPASAVSSVLLLAIVGSSWVMVVEPAYTAERPERRRVRYLQDMLQQKALWEIGAHERTAAPGGTRGGGPQEWQADDQPPALSVRLPRVAGPFRYRARAATLVAPPIEVRSQTLAIEGTSDVWLQTTAVPLLEGTGITFLLPWGVTPTEPSLPGTVANGRWSAAVMPVPPAGITLRVRLTQDALSRLSDGRVGAIVYGVPGGVGWQRLPPWLPQGTVVWEADSYFFLPWPAPVFSQPVLPVQ